MLPDVPESSFAVEVRNASLTYGRGRKAVYALQDVNLNVPRGVIYGLLGPSGCGKTTLLCSVVGRRRLKSGRVSVFGTTPGTKDSCVPGSWVGFMPQELSLYLDFTIEETLTFFGRLHRIASDTLQGRVDFLVRFLDLPRKSKLLSQLSGGQQRRVSFAAALVHSPPLLILDEPTVGVDPLLRQNIWNFLVELTSNDGITVIITTHYIEEARQANVVGLMREGRILAESSPNALLRKFKEPTLEECFLKLCMMDKTQALSSDSDVSPRRITSAHDVNMNMFEDFHDVPSYLKDNRDSNASLFPGKRNVIVDDLVKIAALTSKNMTRLRRNLAIVLFQFALPTIQMVLLCLCVGWPPFDLPLAIVNNEGPSGMGKHFVQKLNNLTINSKFFEDSQLAADTVMSGSTWGTIMIGENFTRNLIKRYTSELTPDNDTIDHSSIKVKLDMTNQQIGLTIQRTLLKSFQEFAGEVLESFGGNPALAQLPVVFEKPAYGRANTQFTEFIAPGVLLSITYIMAVGLTAMSFVEERKSGLLERSWVSGVTPSQVLISHMITQSVVLVLQVSGLLVFTFVVFDMQVQGPFILVVLITMLQGASGMSYGLLISSLVTEEATAIMIALGSFYPNLVMSGIIWPVQGMPHGLRLFSYCLPQTMATEALRTILSRGWGLSHWMVWSAFLVTIAWLSFFLVAAAAVFRVRG